MEKLSNILGIPPPNAWLSVCQASMPGILNMMISMPGILNMMISMPGILNMMIRVLTGAAAAQGSGSDGHELRSMDSNGFN